MAKPPSPAGRWVTCPDLGGHVRQYPAAEVKFRPAAYGIWWHEGRVLLSRSRFTHLWDFPGGGVEPFEWMPDGLQREFQEETGALVTVGELIHTAESFIAFFGRPFHSLRFYYLVTGMPQEWTRAVDELEDLKWWDQAAIPWQAMNPEDREALAQSAKRLKIF
ncbi:NUDIX hydrolase [Sulfobacillus acidophilus TPY]|nr:NUDIX hydrolase [Sulfobacillus acidophilus TPY]